MNYTTWLGYSQLTQKQITTTHLLSEGKSVKEIAEIEGVKLQAVRVRILNIAKKLTPPSEFVEFAKSISDKFGKRDIAKAASVMFGFTVPTSMVSIAIKPPLKTISAKSSPALLVIAATNRTGDVPTFSDAMIIINTTRGQYGLPPLTWPAVNDSLRQWEDETGEKVVSEWS